MAVASWPEDRACFSLLRLPRQPEKLELGARSGPGELGERIYDLIRLAAGSVTAINNPGRAGSVPFLRRLLGFPCCLRCKASPGAVFW